MFSKTEDKPYQHYDILFRQTEPREKEEEEEEEERWPKGGKTGPLPKD